jgi:protein required for attachment to host cells
MSKLWVVVADRSKARIFTVAEPRGPLLEVGELEHPQGREHDRALNSDKPGRAFDSKGHARHSLGTSVEPGKQEAIRFARQVADHVQAAHSDGRCNRLLLVAGPSQLGLLRENLKSLSGMDISEIEKNLGQYDAVEIRKHLPARL